MATKKDHTTEKIMKEVLQTVEKYFPEEFDYLNENPEKKQEFLKIARESVVEELTIGEHTELFSDSDDVRESLAKYLPNERLQLIEEGFTVPTYQIHIDKKVDGKFYADFISEGAPVFAQKKLDNETSIIAASNIQIASIVVETVLFVMQAVGVKLSVSGNVIKYVAKGILYTVEHNAGIQKAIKEIRDAVKGGNKKVIALAMFHLLKAINSAGILWDTFKKLCKSMSYWQWVKTVAVLAASIIAAFATAGAALVIKIVLALNSAYNLIKKFRNLDVLDAIEY